MALASSLVQTSTVPNNPFTDFIDTVSGNFESEVPPSDPTKALMTAISCGLYSRTNGTPLNPVGITGCGLYPLLDIAISSGLAELSLPVPSNANGTPSADAVFITDLKAFYFRTPSAFIGYLNRIHNNINAIIACTLPGTIDSQGFGLTDLAFNQGINTGAVASRNVFNFIRNIYLPGAYTGNTGGELPSSDPELPPVNAPDYKGNGITGAFVVYDNQNTGPVLSRTGIEFYTCLNYLSYGGSILIGSNYNLLDDNLLNFFNGYNPGAIISLDMASYIDGQGITSGNNRAVYGGLEYSYASGNTYNLCHGSTAEFLNNTYANVVVRNNIVNALLDPGNVTRTDFVVIHAGLSGADYSLLQNSSATNQTYADVYRYPGLDGLQSRYQNILSVAGLTSYALTPSQLQRTFCVIGKKKKTIQTNNFSPTGTLTVEIPLVSDVAGAMHRAKVQNNFYVSVAGPSYSKVLNVDSITPASPSNSWQFASTLKNKRINFYQSGTDGYYLATDFVGATGINPTVNDRLGVPTLITAVKTIAENAVQPYASTTNSSSTWASARLAVINGIQANAAIMSALDTAGSKSLNNNVVCDGTNNNTASNVLTVEITIYPKSTFIPGGASPNIAGFNIVVTASE